MLQADKKHAHSMDVHRHSLAVQKPVDVMHLKKQNKKILNNV